MVDETKTPNAPGPKSPVTRKRPSAAKKSPAKSATKPRRSAASKSASASKSTAASRKTAAKSVGSTTTNSGGSDSSSNRPFSEQARERAQAYASDARERARGLADEARHKAGAFANDAKGRTSEAISNLGKLIEEGASVIDERAGVKYGDYVRSAGKSVAGVGTNIDEKDLEELAEDARQFVRKSPALAIGLAATAGFVLSRLIKSSPKED